MNQIEQILFDLLIPMVQEKDSLQVKNMPSINDDEIILLVYAKTEDTARLIGRQGSMASAIRHMMSIPARLENKKITIKFESY